jgi:integrase
MSSTSSQARGWVVKRGPRTYEARWYDSTGKRRSKKGFTTKGAAETHARSAADEVRKVRSGEIAAQRPATMNIMFDMFIEGYSLGIGTRKGRPPEKGTMRAVVSRLQKARDEFGDRDPASLGRHEIETWKARLPDGCRFDSFRALRRACTWALGQGLITRDPSAGIYNPAPRQHERKDITPFASWAEVEAVAAELDVRFAAIPIVLVGTGLRPEELFGLHRADVEYDKERQRGRFIVRRRYTERELKPGLKTGAPERVVPFGRRVYEALDSMPPRIDSLFQFPAARGGPIDIEKWRYREWTPALRAAGVPHRTLYTCRHTYITWALAQGVPVDTVAAWAGTSIQMIQNTYRRYIPAQDEFADRLDAFGQAVGE